GAPPGGQAPPRSGAVRGRGALRPGRRGAGRSDGRRGQAAHVPPPPPRRGGPGAGPPGREPGAGRRGASRLARGAPGKDSLNEPGSETLPARASSRPPLPPLYISARSLPLILLYGRRDLLLTTLLGHLVLLVMDFMLL